MNKSPLKNIGGTKAQMLNLKQANELFKNTVQSYLGITSDEFIERYNKGEYKNICNNSRVLKMLMMMPKNR